MPWIVTKYKSRHSKPHKMKATFLFTETEIGRLAQQPDYCYTIVNTTSRRVSRVGGACKKATPQNLWGSRLRDATAPAAPPKAPAVPPQPVAGWWPFGKKKPKRNPMSKTVMYEPTKGGGYVSRLGRAKRKRRKRR